MRNCTECEYFDNKLEAKFCKHPSLNNIVRDQIISNAFNCPLERPKKTHCGSCEYPVIGAWGTSCEHPESPDLESPKSPNNENVELHVDANTSPSWCPRKYEKEEPNLKKPVYMSLKYCRTCIARCDGTTVDYSIGETETFCKVHESIEKEKEESTMIKHHFHCIYNDEDCRSAGRWHFDVEECPNFVEKACGHCNHCHACTFETMEALDCEHFIIAYKEKEKQIMSDENGYSFWVKVVIWAAIIVLLVFLMWVSEKYEPVKKSGEAITLASEWAYKVLTLERLDALEDQTNLFEVKFAGLSGEISGSRAGLQILYKGIEDRVKTLEETIKARFHDELKLHKTIREQMKELRERAESPYIWIDPNDTLTITPITPLIWPATKTWHGTIPSVTFEIISVTKVVEIGVDIQTEPWLEWRSDHGTFSLYDVDIEALRKLLDK